MAGGSALKLFLRKRKGWVTCTPKQIPIHMCFILLNHKQRQIACVLTER